MASWASNGAPLAFMPTTLFILNNQGDQLELERGIQSGRAGEKRTRKMFQPNNQISDHTKSLSIQDSTALMQVDEKETSLVMKDGMQNGGFAQAESIIYYTKKLQDDLQMMGMKIKQHEDNIKLLKSQRNKLDDSILDLQVILGKYHTSTASKIENEDHSHCKSEEETTKKILQREKSAAGILWQLKTRHGTQAAHLTLTKDVLGIVAMLGKVEDDNLSRLLSEYLGVDTMLSIVCKTYEGVKALETYDNEGCIKKSSGLHGLGASIGRTLEGRFQVICLDNLRPYAGEFVPDDPQRRLDLLKPRLPNGECPPGFLGYAVNMIHVDSTSLFCVTASGHGLRETLFYNLFFRLQIYKTRADMVPALPCISDGAISLDGGMIRSTGVFSLGNREDVDVRFPKLSVTSSLPETYLDSERQINELKWKKEKMQEDMKREQALLDNAKFNFDRKKQDFLKFLADSSSYATQHQFQAAAQSRVTSSQKIVVGETEMHFAKLSKAKQCPFLVFTRQSSFSILISHRSLLCLILCDTAASRNQRT
ncbi:PREDICTED: LOC110908131 isoform [Prunus dulcis]|uniref:PREDICTED: LOC110908131 isoform n=1 Tax=Prunus dulcis TaxID=3755 RepID=A0A5E4E7M1_PRUDU|nr:PREDICTED: LOC110908131 isoform [Prunus dulcis]